MQVVNAPGTRVQTLAANAYAVIGIMFIID